MYTSLALAHLPSLALNSVPNTEFADHAAVVTYIAFALDLSTSAPTVADFTVANLSELWPASSIRA
ncbi:uncharacterized protein MEPE_02569 [Melanopsichium pennsylvanicum]|uniref:Uncharacterized protein n=1 Tax=Melanopsichium pennsylvanicum TaxID=63383 RepID=A0AAJ4XLB5_9BASI|nr:uncharacterized protein MEPE_02569 [Melanopsichium pennsylvanicum]